MKKYRLKDGKILYVKNTRTLVEEMKNIGVTDVILNQEKHAFWFEGIDTPYYVGPGLQGLTLQEIHNVSLNILISDMSLDSLKWTPCLYLKDAYIGEEIEEPFYKNFEDLGRTGLGPIYARADGLKYKLAYKFCMALLSEVDNWEQHYARAKNWFSAPIWARRELSELDKKVFFWKSIADVLNKNPEVFLKEFPEKYHCYTQDNYDKLCKWIDRKTEKIIIVNDNYSDIDEESAIMSALSHGYGDEIGYD